MIQTTISNVDFLICVLFDKYNDFGLFLILISIMIPLSTTSFITIFLNKTQKNNIDDYKKRITKLKQGSQEYLETKQAYYDLWVNKICLLLFFIGLVMVFVF